MEPNATTNENLFEKAENYTRTSLELVKLRTVSASADVLSTITSKIAVGAVVGVSLPAGVSPHATSDTVITAASNTAKNLFMFLHPP